MVDSVAIIGDTHVLDFNQIPLKLIEIVERADWLIHTGDYTNSNVLEGFLKIKDTKFIGVCGNADTLNIMNQLNKIEIVSIQGHEIGITHPFKGGPDHLTKKYVLKLFRNEKLDIIIYGHTHEIHVEKIGNKVLINPGKAYLNYSSAWLVLLNLDHELRIEIFEFKPS
jgi:putative phosphoesterase